ncbi:MAG: hypothetical protein ACRELY_15815, partial [Polyangiaceae bacterium]
MTAALLTGVAYHNRFLQDDAFISFRYARNLAQGRGLVFNAGERVEGITNLLWAVILAAIAKLGAAPEVSSQALGLTAFFATLLAVQALAEELAPESGVAAAFFCGLNYTFSAYATSGLETSTQALAFTLLVLLFARAERCGWSISRCAGLSALAGAALWLRLDSAIPVAVIGGYALVRARKDPKRALALVIPCALLVGSLVAFKLTYYGDVLPNTFYAKTDSHSWE